MSNKWYVVYIGDPRRIRHLPMAVTSIEREASVWIPTRRIIQKTRGRDVEVDRYLFPGYAFVKLSINPHEAESTIKSITGGYFLTSPGGKEAVSISDEDIQTLKAKEMENQKPKSIAETLNLSEGMTVEIKNGPFIGAKGIVKALKRSKVVVEVKIFGRGVLAEVDPASCYVPQNQ